MNILYVLEMGKNFLSKTGGKCFNCNERITDKNILDTTNSKIVFKCQCGLKVTIERNN